MGDGRTVGEVTQGSDRRMNSTMFNTKCPFCWGFSQHSDPKTNTCPLCKNSGIVESAIRAAYILKFTRGSGWNCTTAEANKQLNQFIEEVFSQ